MHPHIHFEDAVLYGNLTYSMEPDSIVEKANNYLAYNTDRGSFYIESDSLIERDAFGPLPGTKQEIDSIANELSKNSISAIIYEGMNGVEESFKSLSGRAPQILHIATHGFYLSEEKGSEKDYYTRWTSLTSGPMVRSGLAFSGAQLAWEGKQIPDHVDDGILLSQEIANLDLSNTDLVILSACETGLGELSSDGVLGLQRGFKRAGVNTIIMSLWKVNDEATAFLMQNFYVELLKGKSKREAFSFAQKETKKIYKDPKFWAAFIMLD